jgi:hypothetical protein
MILTPLQRLQALLHEADLETDLTEADEIPAHPYEQLLVVAGEDDGQNPLVIRLAFVNDMAATMSPQLQEPEEEGMACIILQLSLSLPLKLEERHWLDACYLASVVTRYLPNGAFGVSDVDNVFIRSSLAALERQVNAKVVLEMVLEMTFLAQRFLPVFRQLVEGGAPVAQLIQSVEKEFGG